MPQQNNQHRFDQIKVEASPISLFETPIAYCQIKEGDELMNELEQKIRERKAADEGLRRSNIGGWHSDTEMIDWAGDAAQRLAETAVNVAKRLSHFKEASPDNYQWLVRMWANVTPSGGLNHLHTHPGNLWAAVLYLDMGDDADHPLDSVGGRFYLEDPRFPMSAMKDTSFRLMGVNGTPQQYETEMNLTRGSLVVFPAWLRHGVRVYTGERERISIAMNIDARRKA